MPVQPDIPGGIARWLFRLGIIWAVILGSVAIYLLLFSRGGMNLAPLLVPLGIYSLIGFAVWLGWRRRSKERPALGVAVAFWLFSAAFNSSFVIYFIATGPHWTWVLFYDQSAIVAWWWIAATLASLVALAFEFKLQRPETRTV